MRSIPPKADLRKWARYLSNVRGGKTLAELERVIENPALNTTIYGRIVAGYDGNLLNRIDKLQGQYGFYHA